MYYVDAVEKNDTLAVVALVDVVVVDILDDNLVIEMA